MTVLPKLPISGSSSGRDRFTVTVPTVMSSAPEYRPSTAVTQASVVMNREAPELFASSAMPVPVRGESSTLRRTPSPSGPLPAAPLSAGSPTGGGHGVSTRRQYSSDSAKCPEEARSWSHRANSAYRTDGATPGSGSPSVSAR